MSETTMDNEKDETVRNLIIRYVEILDDIWEQESSYPRHFIPGISSLFVHFITTLINCNCIRLSDLKNSTNKLVFPSDDKISTKRTIWVVQLFPEISSIYTQ